MIKYYYEKRKIKLYKWIEKKSKNVIIRYLFCILIPLIVSVGATYYIGTSIATDVQRKVSHENAIETDKLSRKNALESEEEKAKTIRLENEKNVQNLFTDESLAYINSKLGEPIYSYYTDKILNNFYVVNDNVIECMYDENRLVSYAVFANKKKKSSIKYKVGIFMNKKWQHIQLSEFSYMDLDYSFPYRTEYAFAVDTDAYRYYFEIYEGCEADTNGEFYFIGNYMDVDLDKILGINYSDYPHDNHLDIFDDKGKFFYNAKDRNILKPNVYGRIKRGYQDKVHIIDGFKDVNNRNVIESIFSKYVTFENK